jgi:plastocyanin
MACALVLIGLGAGAASLGWAQGRAHRIAMKDVAFTPSQMIAHIGDTVTWDNADIVAHTATSQPGGFDVDVKPGQHTSAVLTRSGTFGYLCRYHPNMMGQIVVEQ